MSTTSYFCRVRTPGCQTRSENNQWVAMTVRRPFVTFWCHYHTPQTRFSPMLLKFIRPVAAYFCGVEVHIPCNFVISHVKFSIKPSAYWNIFVTVMKRWWQSFIKCLLWSCFFRFKARYSSLLPVAKKKKNKLLDLWKFIIQFKKSIHIYMYIIPRHGIKIF